MILKIILYCDILRATIAQHRLSLIIESKILHFKKSEKKSEFCLKYV